VTAIFILVHKNLLLETMYCFTQKFWRGGSNLSPLVRQLAPPLRCNSVHSSLYSQLLVIVTSQHHPPLTTPSTVTARLFTRLNCDLHFSAFFDN